MAVFCNDRDGFLIVASQDSENGTTVMGFKCHAISDAELEHGLMGVHLTHQPEALHDAVI